MLLCNICDLKNAAILINLTRNVVKKIIGQMMKAFFFSHGQAIYTELHCYVIFLLRINHDLKTGFSRGVKRSIIFMNELYHELTQKLMLGYERDIKQNKLYYHNCYLRQYFERCYMKVFTYLILLYIIFFNKNYCCQEIHIWYSFIYDDV